MSGQVDLIVDGVVVASEETFGGRDSAHVHEICLEILEASKPWGESPRIGAVSPEMERALEAA